MFYFLFSIVWENSLLNFIKPFIVISPFLSYGNRMDGGLPLQDVQGHAGMVNTSEHFLLFANSHLLPIFSLGLGFQMKDITLGGQHFSLNFIYSPESIHPSIRTIQFKMKSTELIAARIRHTWDTVVRRWAQNHTTGTLKTPHFLAVCFWI